MSENGDGYEPQHQANADQSVLADVARKYIPPGYIESLIRTWVPIGIGSVIAWAAVHWHIVVSPGASATVGTVAGALCIAGYYALGRLVEKQWPKVGALLISFGLVQAKPIYAGPADAVRLVDTKTGEVKRVDPIDPQAPQPPPRGKP